MSMELEKTDGVVYDEFAYRFGKGAASTRRSFVNPYEFGSVEFDSFEAGVAAYEDSGEWEGERW